MSDREGKWLPYNLDGSEHECKNRQQLKQETNGQKVNNSGHKSKNTNSGNIEISLEVFLKKLESIGISIDIEKLRNASI